MTFQAFTGYTLHLRAEHRHPDMGRDLKRRSRLYVLTKTADQIGEPAARYRTTMTDQ
jgi:hypothetical protein